MYCIVSWFETQEGASTCPCCRKEVGLLDNVPLVAEPSLSESDSDSDSDSEFEEEAEEGAGAPEEIVIRLSWEQLEDGTWNRVVKVDASNTSDVTWHPSDATPMPTSLEYWIEKNNHAAKIQAVWRGFHFRANLTTALMLLDLSAL